MVEVSQEDREQVRTILRDAAEFIRKKYDLSIPEVLVFLRELLEVV